MPHDYNDQPDRGLFKKSVKDLESWIGKKVKINHRENFINGLFHNLTPWSSHHFLWFIEYLNELRRENPKLFNVLVEKLSSNDFSWEANEILAEIVFLQKIINISDIEIDAKIENGLNPDILIKSKKYGETIIEISRLEDSEESVYSQQCTEKLQQFIFGTQYFTLGAYKFIRRPSEKEWFHFIENVSEQLSSQNEYLIEKTDFVTLIICRANPPDLGLLAKLCEDNNLGYGEMSGWTINENTPDRLIKKIKSKYKYYNKGRNYILSLYGLSHIFFFYGQGMAESILKEISSDFNFPIKYNYRFMYAQEDVAKDLIEFHRIQFKIPNSITMCSYFPKEYILNSTSRELFADLLQNFC